MTVTWKSRRSQNKTFLRGASPGIPYELWDKHTIGWRKWNIATQERKVCDIEVEIAMFVVKEIVELIHCFCDITYGRSDVLVITVEAGIHLPKNEKGPYIDHLTPCPSKWLSKFSSVHLHVYIQQMEYNFYFMWHLYDANEQNLVVQCLCNFELSDNLTQCNFELSSAKPKKRSISYFVKSEYLGKNTDIHEKWQISTGGRDLTSVIENQS